MFIVFLCNINHCNDSAPCWDLDGTIKSFLILSYLICNYFCIPNFENLTFDLMTYFIFSIQFMDYSASAFNEI